MQPGTIFAGCRIEGETGRGGMGVVYRAVQVPLDRRAAIKVLSEQYAHDPAFRERFQAESRLAAGIDHPHVIPIYEAGEEEGRLFVTMRYVEGRDLDAAIAASGQLAPVRAARIIGQVAGALDAAHAQGLVHRDVKPANVLLDARGDGDHAYLTDFGLTKQLGSASGLTRVGQWVGTIDYVAPEQLRGEAVDARTDVYALGAVLSHALTGKVPFERPSEVAKMWAHVRDPVPAPGISPAMDAAVTRAMAKDPAERFASAGELARAVVAAAAEAPAAREELPQTRVTRREPPPTRVHRLK